MKFEINYRWLNNEGIVESRTLPKSIIPRIGDNESLLDFKKDGIVASVTNFVTDDFEKVLVVLR